MWDGGYPTAVLSDFAQVLIRQQVLDIRKHTGKAFQYICIPKLTAFPACKEYLSKMKQSLAALERLQDRQDSE
jgi:hypothetical protein